MDFTSVYLTPKNGTQNTTIQDCIILMEFMQGGKKVMQYLDFLCGDSDSNTNDYHFVLHVFTKFFSFPIISQSFHAIQIWTDGGPHHFKTRYTQFLWHFFSLKKFALQKVSHNFFASYHGHSLADSHAASIKKALHTQYNTSQLQRLCPTVMEVYWGPATAEEFGCLVGHAVANTQVHVFPSIDRDDDNKPDIQPLKDIKKKHCFVYHNGQCRAYEKTGEGVGVQFSFVFNERTETASTSSKLVFKLKKTLTVM